ARRDVRRGGDDLIKGEIDLAGEEIVRNLRQPAIGHVLDLGLGEMGVEQIGEVRDRAGAGAAEGQLVRTGYGVSGEVLERVGRECARARRSARRRRTAPPW